MSRGFGSAAGTLASFAMLLGACGGDSVAGKTTTTTNGGGVAAYAPDGSPIAGALVLAARSWDPERGTWGEVDTLRTDLGGKALLPSERYAFLEIRDVANSLGSWTKRLVVPEGTTRVLRLDTLRSLRGTWADRVGSGAGRLYLDSSFRSTALGDTSTAFDFGLVPPGRYDLMLTTPVHGRRFMGSAILDSSGPRYLGSGNIVLAGDTTGSPLWIEDFESDSTGPLLRRSLPQVAGWYMWSTLMEVSQPTSSSDSAMRVAIGPDSLRSTSAYHSRFVATSPDAWIGFGLTRLHLDVGERSRFCFRYRCDTTVTVQFQRDSLGGARPATSAAFPPTSQWLDACVSTSSFVPSPETPDSLKSWSDFGRSILTLEFHVPAGGTFLDLDDIRMR